MANLELAFATGMAWSPSFIEVLAAAPGSDRLSDSDPLDAATAVLRNSSAEPSDDERLCAKRPRASTRFNEARLRIHSGPVRSTASLTWL